MKSSSTRGHERGYSPACEAPNTGDERIGQDPNQVVEVSRFRPARDVKFSADVDTCVTKHAIPAVNDEYDAVLVIGLS
jgi:hypothetical protein